MNYKPLKIFYIAIFILSGVSGLALSLYLHPPLTQLDRQTFHSPALFVEQIKHDKEAGRKIFNTFCATCHAKKPLIDIKAPRIGNHAAWPANNPANIEALLKITIMGTGAMPARGGCFECSDEQLRETIEYILRYQ